MAGGSAEDLSFEKCSLDEAKSHAIGEELPNIRMTLKKANFKYNRSILAAGGKMQLHGLAGGLAEDLNLEDCYLYEKKSHAIGEELPNIRRTLKKANFSDNSSVSAAGRKMLLRGWAGGLAEDLSFMSCSSNEHRPDGVVLGRRSAGC